MNVDVCVNCGNDEGHYSLCLECLSMTESPYADGVLMIPLPVQDMSDFLSAAQEHGKNVAAWALEALRERAYQ